LILILFPIIPPALGLDDLPSPAYVHWQLAHKLNKATYKGLMLRSKTVVDRFIKLSDARQAEAIREWFQAQTPIHSSLKSQRKTRTAFDTQYEVTPQMSNVDLAKLDVIFLYKGMRPVFHTEFFLRALYSADLQDGSKFRIDPNMGWPTKISFGFHSGPRGEPRSSSFDQFNSKQLKLVLNWINGSAPIEQLEPMTLPKMIDQIMKYER
jgi:hypothetical protein